jgi:hypothetical protein
LLAAEIKKITRVSGGEVMDFGYLYEPHAGEDKEQLVVHFEAMRREKRAKSERMGDGDSDSEEEYMNRVEEVKKKALECERCGGVYERGEASCQFHPGTWSLRYAETRKAIPMNDALEVNPEYERESCMTMVSEREWTCCSQKSRLSAGCTSGKHTINHLFEHTLDQKLESFFSSASALEAPEIADKQVSAIAARAPANQNGNDLNNDGDEEADDDDDVQIIGRRRLLGNANPQGCVNLNPILHSKKCFCLNESIDHPLDSILFTHGAGVTFLQSDCDAELIITVGFTSNVKLHLIRISVINLHQAPSNISIFLNKSGRINFDNASSMKPDQVFELKEDSFLDQTTAILQLQASKFSLTETVTLYISSNLGNSDTTVISSINFVGAAPNVR